MAVGRADDDDDVVMAVPQAVPIARAGGRAGDEDVVMAGPQAVRIPLGHPPVVFALPGSEQLVDQVLGHLSWKPGVVRYRTFDNGEISVKVDQSVANRDVFIVRARDDSKAEVNNSMMTLMMLIDAIRGEAPYRITVILPSLEYARQDRRIEAGEAIPPKLLLRCMRTAGADRFLTVDLHNQAEAAFSPAGAVLDELSADTYLAHFIRSNIEDFDEDCFLVCATNGGGMKFTRRLADQLRTGFIMADRFRSKAGGPGQIKIIADASHADKVKGIVIVDDMFDTCGSLAGVCEALQDFAPQARLYAAATHGYFSGEAHSQIKRLVDNANLEWLLVTNSIDQQGAQRRLDTVGIRDCLKVVDISRLLAGAIIRIHIGDSVNLPQFRSLCPSAPDPVLAEAPLVPREKYSHIFSAKDGSPRATSWE